MCKPGNSSEGILIVYTLGSDACYICRANKNHVLVLWTNHDKPIPGTKYATSLITNPTMILLCSSSANGQRHCRWPHSGPLFSAIQSSPSSGYSTSLQADYLSFFVSRYASPYIYLVRCTAQGKFMFNFERGTDRRSKAAYMRKRYRETH